MYLENFYYNNNNNNNNNAIQLISISRSLKYQFNKKIQLSN